MNKVIITGKSQADLVEVPTPKATKDWALVKIHSAPMCCEYKAYRDGEECDCIGHEAAGEVVEIGQPGYVEVGDRVVVMPQYPCGICDLCLAGEYIHCEKVVGIEDFTGSPEGTDTYAEYLLKPDWLLPKIPEGISYDHASMLCCGLGPTFGAMERMNVNAFDTVLLTGMGPVGLGGVINAKHRGARVIVVSGTPYRSNLALELGADTIIDPKDPEALDQIMHLTKGVGVTKAIECAGVTTIQRLCIDATARNGHVAFVGESGDLNIRVSDDIIRKGLTLLGAWHYNRVGVSKLFQIVQESAPLMDKLITHTFPLSQVTDAWELQMTRQCGKVVLHPNE
jgi:L-iditol 2-dehydrogenase